MHRKGYLMGRPEFEPRRLFTRAGELGRLAIERLLSMVDDAQDVYEDDEIDQQIHSDRWNQTKEVI